MSPSVAILLYGFVFLSTLALLTFVASIELFQNFFFRVFTGGSFGGFTSWYLLGVTPFLSYLEGCVNGDFHFGGYFSVIALFAVLAVWGFNLYQYNGRLVV